MSETRKIVVSSDNEIFNLSAIGDARLFFFNIGYFLRNTQGVAKVREWGEFSDD